jgi:hypothetical protein
MATIYLPPKGRSLFAAKRIKRAVLHFVLDLWIVNCTLQGKQLPRKLYMLAKRAAIRDLIVEALEKQRQRMEKVKREELQNQAVSLRRQFDICIEKKEAEIVMLEKEICRLQDISKDALKVYSSCWEQEKEYGIMSSEVEFYREEIIDLFGRLTGVTGKIVKTVESNKRKMVKHDDDRKKKLRLAETG